MIDGVQRVLGHKRVICFLVSEFFIMIKLCHCREQFASRKLEEWQA